MTTAYSIAYLAGAGARALGLEQYDNPFPHSDHDRSGDFLNGFADGPAPDDPCDDCHLGHADDEADANLTAVLDAEMDARLALAKALFSGFEPAPYGDAPLPSLKDLVAQATLSLAACPRTPWAKEPA